MAKTPRKGLTVTDRLERARANRYKVIQERNRIIKWAIRASGAEAHVLTVKDPGTWTAILCIHTDAGQLHWKLSPEDAKDFASLPLAANDHYDGCKSSEKGERLDRLAE